jgi:predicted MFS family arabinose efflux permease
MALVSAAGLLPGILTSRYIGRLCDHRNPRSILLFSILCRVFATLGILFTHQYFAFVILIAVRSLFAAVAPLAINVMAVRCVEPEDRPRFYSSLNVLNSIAKICAPVIGTVCSSLASERFALVLSTGFSLIAIITLAFITVPKPNVPDSINHGTSVPTTARSMVPILWIVGTYFFFLFMVNNQLPLILQKSGFDKSLLGMLVGCSGAGNILSGIWLAKQSKQYQLRGTIEELLVPASLHAIGFLVFGLILWIAAPSIILLVVFFAIGIASARFAVAMSVYMATHYANAIGGASGMVQTFQNTMILVAPLFGAVILDTFGPAMIFYAAAGSALVSFTTFYLVAGNTWIKPSITNGHTKNEV